MSKHEQKICPRCNGTFECKVGNITQCQCYGIKFTSIEKDRVAGDYIDCLCAGCMLALQSEYNTAHEKRS